MSQGLPKAVAAILVGGLGTRLAAVVSDRPKPLAEVGGRPFLDRLFEQLAAAGVPEAVLLTGHMGDRVEARYGAAHGAVAVRYSHEETPMGTGGALRLALSHLATPTVLLLNGDSFVDVDVRALLADHAKRPGPSATMTLVHVPDASRYGRVEIDPERAVTSFVEKGGDASPGWINAGVTAIDRSLIEALPEGQPLSLERDAMPGWAAARQLFGFPTEGRFIDIGTPTSYAESQTFF